MKLSKSAVNSFLKCRREFMLSYIDGIKQETNEYMLRGTDVHNIAETFVKEFDRDEDFFEKLMSIYTSMDSKFELKTHLYHLAEFFEEVFCDEEEPYKIFSAEEYIYDEEHNFSGLADLIVENEDGDLIIIDYKTSKTNPIKKYLLELTYYKMLVNYKYPDKNVISAGIFFTKDGGMKFTNFCEEQPKGSFVTQEDEQAAIDLLDFIRQEVKENNLYPERQFLCQYCGYKDICEDMGGF